MKVNKKMEKKGRSKGETSKLTQDMQIFFDLVDREGYRLQMLDEMKVSQVVKPLAVYPSPSHLSFEIEDFGVSPNEKALRVMAQPSKDMKEKDKAEAQEEKMNRGIKRQIELNLAPRDKERKSKTSRIFICDLNKGAESLDDTN